MARAVLGGAFASLGVAALLSPALLWAIAILTLVAAVYAALGVAADPLAVIMGALPILVGLALAFLVGGYVAGALSRGARARSGGIAALLSLFLLALLALGTGVVDVSLLAGVVVAIALLGIPVAMVFGRVGAVMAPRAVEVRTVERPGAAAPASRPAYRLLPAVGMKGGEREDERLEERIDGGDDPVARRLSEQRRRRG